MVKTRVPCVLVLFTITVVIDLGGLVYHWLLRDRVSITHRVMVQGAWHEPGQPITEVHPIGCWVS